MNYPLLVTLHSPETEEYAYETKKAVRNHPANPPRGKRIPEILRPGCSENTKENRTTI